MSTRITQIQKDDKLHFKVNDTLFEWNKCYQQLEDSNLTTKEKRDFKEYLNSITRSI